MSRSIVVDVIGDSSKFNKATSDAVGHAHGLTSSLKHSAVAGAVAGAAMAITTDILTIAVGQLSGAAEAAKIDTESQDRLALALKNTGKHQSLSTAQIEAAITANQKKGVSDDAQRQGISDFLDITKSSTDAMKLNSATIDLAAAKGISYADAEGIIKSAAAGRTGALKKAGVEVAKHASITEIATDINKKFGGSIDDIAQTQSGKAAIANEKMGEAMESVGRIINDIAINVVPPLIGAFADIVTWVTDLVRNNQPLINQLTGILKTAFNFITTTVLPALGKAFQWIVTNVLPLLIKAFDWIVTNVLPKLKTAFNFFTTTVLPLLSKAFDWISKNVLPPLMDIIGKVAAVATNVLAVAFQVITKTVIPALSGAFDFLTKNVFPPIKTGLGILGDAAKILGGIFGTLATNVAKAWGSILGAIKSVINTIIGGWNSLKFSIPSVDLGPLGKIGGFTIGTPNIPYLHSGGIVPGVPGSDVLTMLQAGERVTPRSQVGTANGITIIVQGDVYGDGIDRLADRLAQRLRLQGV